MTPALREQWLADLRAFSDRTQLIIWSSAFGAACAVGEQAVPGFFRVPLRLLAVAALVLAGCYGIFSASALAQASAPSRGTMGPSAVRTNVAATAAYSVLCLVVAAYFLFHI